jgi:N-acylglucosamine 2-epimerase
MYAQIAMDTFERIMKRKDAPKGAYEKGISDTRPMQNFALPMILCNLALELEHLIGAQRVSELTKGLIPLILEQFYDKESGLILENIGPNGAQIDSFEGRLLNPGHAIEAMWFIMNLGIRSHDKAVIDKAEAIMYHHLEQGWDHEHGGIFYFLDRKGHPTQQLEWDQKLWWVHLETLVALAKTYAYNKSPKAKEWFVKVHDYSWNHFRDPIHKGEWYGYLTREGKVLLPLKGGKWKGCFHVPRALYEISNTLALIDG